MSLVAEIKVGLKLGESNYNIGLVIPSSAPTAEAPYRFNVAEGENSQENDLLVVAVGGENRLYVAVSPPQEILDLTGDVVTDLEVVVNNGGYNRDGGTFPATPELESPE